MQSLFSFIYAAINFSLKFNLDNFQKSIYSKFTHLVYPIFILGILGSLMLTVPGQADDNAISEEIVLRNYTQSLSQDSFVGRKSKTDGNARGRTWIVEWMTQKGIHPAGNANSYNQIFNDGVNIIGSLKTIKTDSKIILLGAHHDHWGSECKQHPLAKSKVCNGAADNASAVAVIMSAADQLQKENLDSVVVVAFWDAEEQGLKGSRHFSFFPTINLSNVKLYINLDIVGLNLKPSLAMHHLALGAETGGQKLNQDLNTVVAQNKLIVHQASYGLGHNRSDMTSFVYAGRRIPFVFFTDADGSVYHTTADEFEHINFTKLWEIRNILIGLVKIADKQVYHYQPPIVVLGQVLPVFSDIESLRNILGSAVKSPDSWKSEDIAKSNEILAQLIEWQKQGPNDFNPIKAVRLGLLAKDFLTLSKENSLKQIP